MTKVKTILDVVEMNMGQMVEDVRLAVNGKAEVSFYGRPGGAVLAEEDILAAIHQCGVRSVECGVKVGKEFL